MGDLPSNTHVMQNSKRNNNLVHSGIDCSIRMRRTVEDQVAEGKALAGLERDQVAMGLGNTVMDCHRHNIRTISNTTKPSNDIPNLGCWGTRNLNRGKAGVVALAETALAVMGVFQRHSPP